jgi:UDP-glucose:(heptosyl)LPS alpha-1,3-glucosyltransferase
MKLGLARRGYSSSGGAEAYLKRFAYGLAAAGHQPVLFASERWPEWPHELRVLAGGRSPGAFARALLAETSACDYLFSLERVLACDCYRAGDGVHAAWLERRARHEAPWRPLFRRLSGKHRELLRLEETMFRHRTARRVIANSRMVKEEIVAAYGYPAGQIDVIYNGVPAAPSPAQLADWRREKRRELGLEDGDYVVLFAGSGWERKGLRFAIEAMNRAALAGSVLLVAGHGRPGAMPASTRTRYLGAVRGLARTLAAADAFILPTLYDPFSNACLEALAAGLPVITTTANGFAEILEPGEGEAVADPADTPALARAIESWAPRARRDEAREPLREKGRAFTVERNVRETLAVVK